MGGQLIRMCTSAAPAALIIDTILRLVVPRTMESSTSTTRCPSRMLRTVFSFTFTLNARIDCCGWMKVRPTKWLRMRPILSGMPDCSA